MDTVLNGKSLHLERRLPRARFRPHRAGRDRPVDRRPQRAVVAIPLRRRLIQRRLRIAAAIARLGQGIGQIGLARRPAQHRPAGPIALLGGFGQTGHRPQQCVEGQRRVFPRLLCPRPAQPVEPPQVRQQQPRIEPPPHRNQLAAKEHRLFHPLQRAFGQHRLAMPPRQHQRRPPPFGKQPIPPPREIEAGPRDPHPRRRHPHVAMPRKLIQKPRLALRGQDGIVRKVPLPGQKPLPVGEGLGRGFHASSKRQAASAGPHLPNPPLKGREQAGLIPRQPDIPRNRHPPAPKPLPVSTPALAPTCTIHDRSPCSEANRPCCRFWGSRKIQAAGRITTCRRPPR